MDGDARVSRSSARLTHSSIFLFRVEDLAQKSTFPWEQRCPCMQGGLQRGAGRCPGSLLRRRGKEQS